MTEAYGTEPRLIGQRYELGAVIGYGGMAEVFRGRDVRLGREIAVKALRPDLARDPTFLARFRREAQSSAALNHPAIVSVYDTGEDVINGVHIPYIVMEYIEGRTLRDILQTQGRLSEHRAMEITSDVCAALDYSHRMGIIHRDIKPANVMLCPDGSVKVMDFGIARATTATSSTMTATAAVIGTAQYLSPEQARGARVDARSDVYSTGVLFYELLTGQPPFRGDNPVAVAYQHVRENPQPPSYHDRSISPKADAIVFKAMEKEPDERYATAGQMRDDLERALAGRPIRAPMSTGGDAMATRVAGSAPTSAATRAISRDRAAYGEPYTDRYEDPYQNQYDAYPDRTERYENAYQDRDPRYGSPEDTGAYGDDSDGGEARRPSQAWKYVLLGLSLVLVFVVVTLLATSFLGGTGGDAAKNRIRIPTGLIGKQASVVKAQLEDLGFTAVELVNEENDNAQKDSVLAVDPAMGTEIDKTAKVTLTVAVEPGKITVPDVIGRSEATATQLLTAAGFHVTSDEFSGPTTKKPGTVEATDPAGNTSAKKGSLVVISVVSKTAQIPPVTGKPAQAAHSTLESYGFVVDEQQVDNTAPAGTVVGLNYAEGLSVPRGTQVTVYVSRGVPVPSVEPTQTPAEQPTDTPTSAPPFTIPPIGGEPGQ